MKMCEKIWVIAGVCFVIMISVFCAPATAQAPQNVYVADFLIDEQAVSEQNSPRQGLLQGLRPGIIRPKEDPVEQAQNLVQLLSESLVNELDNKGIPASSVSGLDELAHAGVLVQGEFLELDEGNRLQRAAIGFGSGATQMEVRVFMSKLPLDENKPEVTFDSQSKSGKGPGGLLGLAICGNPYALAAKFVLSKHATQKDVRKLAADIATEIQRHLQGQQAM